MKAKVNRKKVVRVVRKGDFAYAKLAPWLVEMAKAVGASRTPREDVSEVLERLAGDSLVSEYESVTSAMIAVGKGGGV